MSGTTAQAAPPPGDGAEPVRVRNVSHKNGAVTVLRHISFTARAGEVFGIVGAVGSGKTTLARLLSSACEPSVGSIEITGFDTALHPDRARRALGYLPHPAVLYTRLSVREYLDFFRRLQPGANANAVSQMLERTRLTHRQHELVQQLNEGQRQRLGLARALLHDPKVLILDEPMSNVDPLRRDALVALLAELKHSGKALVLLSPILAGLGELCDHIGILHQGRLLAQGTPSDIVEQVGAKSVRSGFAVIEERLSLTDATEDRRSYLDPVPPSSSDPEAQPPGSQHGAQWGTDSQRLRLRCLGDAKAAVPLLSALSSISQVEVSPDGSVLVTHHGDDHFVAEIVNHLTVNNIALIAVEPQHTPLERFFRSLTQGSGGAP